jgi:hypothetical protein
VAVADSVTHERVEEELLIMTEWEKLENGQAYVPFPKPTASVKVSDKNGIVRTLSTLENEVHELRKAIREDGASSATTTASANAEARSNFEVDVETAGGNCPPATQDIQLNLANRQNAIDNVGYGPLNPAEPNEEFWQDKADRWNIEIADAKTAV